MRKGKKTIAWDQAREKLKVKFEEMGVTECELRYAECWRGYALGFAHAKKRANLKPHELVEVILACVSCHNKIEILPEKEMTEIVRSVIKKRKRQRLTWRG